MAQVMSNIIDPAQSTLLVNRGMAENMLLTQQLVRSYGRTTASPRCMLMADIRKAFDTISWEFIDAILKGFGFPAKFRSLIMECVSTASYSIALNGGLHGFYHCKRY